MLATRNLSSPTSLLLKRGFITGASLLGLVALLILGSIPAAWLDRPQDLPPVPVAKSYVLDNVHTLDVEHGKLNRHQQLTIRAGRITAIQPAGAAADPALTVIDGAGRYVTPGLTDMHVHLYDRKDLLLNLAYGVTSVRNLRGLPMHLRWRQELRQQQWLGANLYTASPVLDGPRYAHALQQVVRSPDHGRALVKRYKAMGYDLIKAYGYLPDDILQAVLAEAKASNIPVAKHGPFQFSDLPVQALAGLQSLEHVEDIFQGPLNYQFDQALLRTAIEQLRQIDPVITPTLATFNQLTEISDKKLAYVETLPLARFNRFFRELNELYVINRWLDAKREQADWNIKERDFLFTIVRELDSAGIRLLVGSDAGTLYLTAGLATHEEMQLLQQAGLSPARVIQAATINAARAMGIDANNGSIAVGKIADLVLSSHSPLEDVTGLQTPSAVIKQGHWLAEADLERLKKSGENPSHWYPSLGRLLEDILSRLLH
ncbi:amidohydrolase family protein [Simiduia curdlanivorans]|uniref:Amidohydrolase family protein n=1 Tax=Simiduia curdlanivorans TaxID=1492769 RepID=A0ABV8V628_9GAMM|nr:amidohydrolase family protein [Simiduia curdlanivorans]MDN3638704.1 amidohydrolase family protein [Simiduia curdlanivorans]